MKYFRIDLSQPPKVSMIGSSFFTAPEQHIRRHITEQIIYLIRKGSITLAADDREIVLRAGDVHLFTVGEYQYAKAMDNCEFYFVHFSPESVSTCEWTDEAFVNAVCERKLCYVNHDRLSSSIYSSIGAYLPQTMHIEDAAIVEQVFAFCRLHTVSCAYLPPIERLRLAVETAGLLMRLEEIAYNKTTTGYKGKNGRVHESAARILSYVEQHFAEALCGQDIERNLLMNYDYANRIFKRHVGTSIMQYRNRLRVNSAKPLFGHKSIEEIARAVGFENVYYFSRCFKRFEGISPREYAERINE